MTSPLNPPSSTRAQISIRSWPWIVQDNRLLWTCLSSRTSTVTSQPSAASPSSPEARFKSSLASTRLRTLQWLRDLIEPLEGEEIIDFYQYMSIKLSLFRYLTRKIGFEAVMRIRCTRGMSLHTFHGHFFVRSTDLLSLPNVNPDSGFGMQVAIEEDLKDCREVSFQAALLYTSSKVGICQRFGPNTLQMKYPRENDVFVCTPCVFQPLPVCKRLSRVLINNVSWGSSPRWPWTEH